jgi:hypothetical protein
LFAARHVYTDLIFQFWYHWVPIFIYMAALKSSAAQLNTNLKPCTRLQLKLQFQLGKRPIDCVLAFFFVNYRRLEFGKQVLNTYIILSDTQVIPNRMSCRKKSKKCSEKHKQIVNWLILSLSCVFIERLTNELLSVCV